MSMPKRISLFAALIGSSSATTCEELCDNLESCKNDPRAHGSYCKTWNEPQTCFGLFFRDEERSTMCFQPNDSTCPQSRPVSCPEDQDGTSDEPSRESAQRDQKKQPTTCQEVCDEVDACRDDPHAHGSYCKFIDGNPICFGLYKTGKSKEKICFEPNDSDCPENDPVGCPEDEVTALQAALEDVALTKKTAEPKTCQEICDTVESCYGDPHAHGSYCKLQDSNPICFGLYLKEKGKKDMCFQPNDSDCPEDFPVTCPDDEVMEMTSAAASEANGIEQLTCQQLCDGLTECRDDPQAHGSYCKTWGNPSPVCFGMYYTSEAKDTLCFQPNNKACPNKYPVYCAAT